MKPDLELERRLHSLDTLGEAVRAMKSLSAHHFLEARRGVEPARSYREGVERVLALAGADLPAGEGGAGLLIVGAELGLCGRYNEQIVEAGSARRAALGKGPTFCVGRRAAQRATRKGLELERSYPAPASVGGVTPLLLDLAEDLLNTYARARLASFDIVSSRFRGVGNAEPVRMQLLPVVSGGRPFAPGLRYSTPETLRRAALREFLYASLHGLLLDALASEHGARLIATQAAEQWLDDTRARLRRKLASARREASTQEMLEIASGARARAARTAEPTAARALGAARFR